MPKSLLIISYNSNESFEYFPFFFSHRIFYKSKTASVASGTGTAYLFGAPEFTLGFFLVPLAQSLAVYCFVDRCLPFCLFTMFGHCILCPSMYGLWLFLWFLQTSLPAEEHQSGIDRFIFWIWTSTSSFRKNPSIRANYLTIPYW